MDSELVLPPFEVTKLTCKFLPLSDLTKLAPTIQEMRDGIIANLDLLQQMFFEIDSLDSENLNMRLWSSFDAVEPNVQHKNPLNLKIQEFKKVLNLVDQVGESAKKELKVEGSDVLTIQKGFYHSMILVLQRLYPFFRYRGALLLPSMQRELEKISDSIMPSDRSDAVLDCIATIEGLVEKVKSVYLLDAIQDRQEDRLNMLCFVAIALTPEWHQLVLEDSALHWEQVIRSQTQKMPGLIFHLLEQPVFQKFIGNHTAKLLSFVKLPHQPLPKGPAIALEIYDYCVNHYVADIQKEVFDHYDALYPKVFKELKEASSSNEVEREQPRTAPSFRR